MEEGRGCARRPSSCGTPAFAASVGTGARLYKCTSPLPGGPVCPRRTPHPHAHPTDTAPPAWPLGEGAVQKGSSLPFSKGLQSSLAGLRPGNWL